MGKFSEEELKQRAFERVAWVLKHFYDEQEETYKVDKGARVHTRIFERLIFDGYIILGKSEQAAKLRSMPYREHVVPCAYIRDRAFRLFHEGKEVDDVARMVGRLLKIVFITPDEAKQVDQKYKDKMPDDWDWMNDPVTRRLDDVGIKVIP